jgi:hypothetical protein
VPCDYWFASCLYSWWSHVTLISHLDRLVYPPAHYQRVYCSRSSINAPVKSDHDLQASWRVFFEMAVSNTVSDIQNHQCSELRHESVLYMTIAYDYSIIPQNAGHSDTNCGQHPLRVVSNAKKGSWLHSVASEIAKTNYSTYLCISLLYCLQSIETSRLAGIVALKTCKFSLGWLEWHARPRDLNRLSCHELPRDQFGEQPWVHCRAVVQWLKSTHWNGGSALSPRWLTKYLSSTMGCVAWNPLAKALIESFLSIATYAFIIINGIHLLPLHKVVVARRLPYTIT